ncbi:hypothetical protein CDD83_3213 [Cordyceps sp. RAO-2017]|nr:hypothetical protein CDD83_3213 [Cordyceps sp. RAO-2017]
MYRNPSAAAPASRGLGGHLAIVLGLMAFSNRGRADEVFLGGPAHSAYWRDRLWTCPEPPAKYPPSTEDLPCGFYVAVFYDPENPAGSTPDGLHSFEWDGAIVREPDPT